MAYSACPICGDSDARNFWHDTDSADELCIACSIDGWKREPIVSTDIEHDCATDIDIAHS